MAALAYIGFGSNLGDLIANFQKAREELCKAQGVRVLRAAKLYYTEPLTLAGEEQPWYLNSVFEVETALNPLELFECLKNIEKNMGRQSSRKWAPRLVDLDLLFFDRLIYTDNDLKVPHPEIINRKFVLLPLLDLIPDFLHPEFGMPIHELLHGLEDGLKVTSYEAPRPEGTA